MGAYVDGRCYGTHEDAETSALAAVPPAIRSSDGHLFVTEQVAGSWQISEYQGSVVVNSWPAPDIAFASCNPADSLWDGVTVAWLVVAAWVAGFMVQSMRKALNY